MRTTPHRRPSITCGSYKTRLCSTYASFGSCMHSATCGFAHGGTELRREAAVQQGLLDRRYKTSLCETYWAGGRCVLGGWGGGWGGQTCLM